MFKRAYLIKRTILRLSVPSFMHLFSFFLNHHSSRKRFNDFFANYLFVLKVIGLRADATLKFWHEKQDWLRPVLSTRLGNLIRLFLAW